MIKFAKLICTLLTIMLMMSVMSESVYASDLTPGVEGSATDDVIQNGDASTFTYNMPFATYRVYPSYLKPGGTYMTSFEAMNSDFELLNYYYDPGVTNFDNAVFYTGSIAPGNTATINGTAFVLTYKGAAVDIEGKSHDVRITVSDVSIYNGDPSRTSRAVSLCWGGFGIRCYMFDSATLAANASLSDLASHRINTCYADVTLKMEVLDTTYDGAFVFNTRDIDVEDRTTGSYSSDHSERILINSGLKSKAYITASPNNLLNVSRTADGLLFRGTQADDNTFYSGFAAMLDTTNVIKWSGGRCATAIYGGSYTLGIRPLYKGYNSDGTVDTNYTIGTKGGDISMSESYDGSDIVYSNQSQLTGSKYTVRFYANHKPVTIKMEPEDGYRLVNFNSTTTSSSTNFTGDPITVTNNTYSFTTANENARYYNAFYEPITSSVKIHKVDQDGNPMEGVTFTATGTSSALGSFNISAETDGNGDAVIDGIPYGTANDPYTLTETVPAGYSDGGIGPVTFYYKDEQQNFSFTNNKVYNVTYIVNDDPNYGIPQDSVTPTDNTQYILNDLVTVADNLTTTQDYAVDPTTGNQIPGTWTFTPWDKDDFNITENTTITGAWKFTPDTFAVDYIWTGDIPDSVTLPTDTNVYNWHDTPNVDLTYTSSTSINGTKDGVPGTFTFSGWDASDDPDLTADGMEGNVTFKGVWKFTPDKTPDTYKVNYVVNGDNTYGSPSDAIIPTDGKAYNYNDKVTVADNLTTTWKTSDGTSAGIPGTWTFTPWDKDDFRITKNTTITGTWKFTPASIPPTPTPKPIPPIPLTGDNSQITSWLMLLTVSAIGMIGTAIWNKKKTKTN